MEALPSAESLPEPERWCAGLPWLGERRLTPAEREAIEAVARRELRRWGASLGVTAILVAAPILFIALRLPRYHEPADALLYAGTLFGSLTIAGISMLRARDRWRARSRFLSDLAVGTVDEFGGVVDATALSDPESRALIDAGMLVQGRPDEQRIAVLTVTRSVVHRDPRRGWCALPVRVRAVAAAPAYAMRAPVPREIASAHDPHQQLVKRSLNAAERDELRRYIGQVRRLWPFALFLAFYGAICMLLFLGWLRSSDRPTFNALVPLIGLALMSQNAMRLVHAYRRAGQFSRDLATGWAVMLEQRRDVDDAPAPPSLPGREFLPHSGALWTQNGRPASWRNLLP